MRRLLIVVAIALAPVPAAGAAVRDAPTPGVATCLRATGAPGEVTALGPLTRTTSSIDVLDAATLMPVANTAPGNLSTCPESASGGGTTVVAGVATATVGSSRAHIRAALRDGTGPFAEPVELGTVTGSPSGFAAAVGANGDVAVAWIETRGDLVEDTLEQRVMLARRPAGGSFAAAAPIADWARTGRFGVFAQIAAGVDGNGATTLVWTHVGRGTEPGAALVKAATAERSAPARAPQTLARTDDVSSKVALAVSPAGRAVAVWTAIDGTTAAERPGAGQPFGAPVAVSDQSDIVIRPVVAVSDDGGAAIAWQTGSPGDGLRAAVRPPGGSWSPTQDLGDQPSPDGSSPDSFGVSYYFGSSSGPRPPAEVGGPHVVLTAGGAITATWVDVRPYRGDQLPTAWVARGTLTGGLGRAERVSGECRAANGAVPVPGPDDDTAVAWTDNASTYFTGDLELPTGNGRLHVGAPAAGGGPSPVAGVSVPRGVQRIYYDEPLHLTASCDAACDVRAWVPGGNGPLPRAATSATLTHAGRVRIDLTTANLEHVIPTGARSVAVMLRVCGADGRASRPVRAIVAAARRPIPPLAVPQDVTARRSGDRIVVTWRTAVPARRVTFYAAAALRRKPAVLSDIGRYRSLPGHGHRKFRLALRLKGARYVSLGVEARDPPFREKSLVVKIR